MKKVEIRVEERISYEDEIVVIQPDSMSDEEFDSLVEKAEKKNRRFDGGAKDFAYYLEEFGLEIESHSYSFPESPMSSDFEIVDVRDVK